MPTGRDKFAAGFTMVELLLAFAITVLLIAAAAVAFNASVMNYKENEDVFSATNGARQALSRITSQLRTGLVDPNTISDPNRCKLLCADGSTVTYRYDPNDNTLYRLNHGTGTENVLCENVTAMSFEKDIDASTGDVKSVQISMTVECDNIHRTVAAAAVIRKVLE
ncbi:MAG: PilW family protein [Planctomycetota bacterium]|jgi:type II secretory pathway pseudopilin PulG